MGVDLSFENIEWVCVALQGLKGPPHMGRSNIAVPSIYKEVHDVPNDCCLDFVLKYARFAKKMPTLLILFFHYLIPRTKQQKQRQGKKFNFFPESAVTQLTAMKHFFTSLFSPNFLPETQTTTQYLIWHYGKIFIILPIMEWNQGSGWCRVESQTKRVWQWCATMMSWVQRWVELVVY